MKELKEILHAFTSAILLFVSTASFTVGLLEKESIFAVTQVSLIALMSFVSFILTDVKKVNRRLEDLK